MFSFQKSPDWAKDEATGLKILRISQDLCEYSLEASAKFEDNEKMLVLSQLSSARLSAMSSVKVATSNQWESCAGIVDSLNQLLEKIVEKIKELK